MSPLSSLPSSGSRVPVFLLTGFLGSGKTTLLNRLMRTRPNGPGKLAIVVNEFGAVGIDGDLLPSSMTRQVELPGGCICCLLSEELDRTLMTLLSENPDIEMIVIETTGIAEPLAISWSLAREPVGALVRLAAVITVVDVLNFISHRPLSPAVDGQVEYADILVSSKTDLLPVNTTLGAIPTDLERILDELNPTALRVSGSDDEITRVLWRSIMDPIVDQPNRPPTDSPMTTRRSEPTHENTHHDHDEQAGHGFETISMVIDELIDFEELSEMLEQLPSNYVRIKGIARVVDESTGSSEPHWVAFHRVGTRVSCEPLDNPSDSRVVALGSGLQIEVLAACVEAAVIP